MPKLNDGVTEAVMNMDTEEFKKRLSEVSGTDEMMDLMLTALLPKYAPKSDEFKAHVVDVVHELLNKEETAMSRKEFALRDKICKQVALFYSDELSDWMCNETSDRQMAAKHQLQ